MRLIDADRLNEVIERNITYPDAFKQLVDIQPTAYDVDKVLKQLEEYESISNIYAVKGEWQSAIEIVKSGMKG